MDAQNGSAGVTAAPRAPGAQAPGAQAPGVEDPLPDLLALDLAELGTIGHPVLRELLAELRERAGRSSEPLWGFASAL